LNEPQLKELHFLSSAYLSPCPFIVQSPYNEPSAFFIEQIIVF
jgi:hypothetical protein